jgi:hypothetical protein
MVFQDAQRSQEAARPAAPTFRTWSAYAGTGERLQYDRSQLVIDQIRGMNSPEEQDRRKLAAAAQHSLALAGRNQLHLLQGDRADGDNSYGAVTRAPVRGGQA